ncbi:hypothetical protein PtA15_2A698 [Puccinia triticina]|uniref:Uncharacterized protein n=1 Tax=Puccinia triticina TaxID=208348 RepID=A0ABY7CB07_9BASI|nr:uncharacterized protein PtA15_2A698 [Puccinia triticina]WAQ82381.1 hypothetical protein PtA15_2A698 [Puccinia triticina]
MNLNALSFVRSKVIENANMSQPLSGHPSWDQLDSNPNPLSDPNSNRGPLSNPNRLLPSDGRVDHGQYNYSNMSNPNPLSDPNSNRGPLSNPLLPSDGRVDHGQYNYSNMAGFNHTPTPMAQPEAQDQHVDTRLMDVADQGHGGPGFPQGPNPPGESLARSVRLTQ